MASVPLLSVEEFQECCMIDRRRCNGVDSGDEEPGVFVWKCETLCHRRMPADRASMIAIQA